MQEFSHWRVFVVAAYELAISYSFTSNILLGCGLGMLDALFTDVFPIKCAALGGLLGLCVYWLEVLTPIWNCLLVCTPACRDASPRWYSSLSQGGFPHFNLQ